MAQGTKKSSSPNDRIEVIGQSETVRRLAVLIDEARERVWLVSPYSTLEKLRNLTRTVERALKRGVAVSLAVREPDQSTHHSKNSLIALSQLVSSGLKLYSVRDLHAKIYASERHAILTSLNLLDSSFNNSIEVGLWIPRASDVFEQTRDFFSREILPHARESTPEALLSLPPAGVRIPVASKQAQTAINHQDTVYRSRKKERGFCIVCEDRIPLNPDRPYCFADYSESTPGAEEYVCHGCGEPFPASLEEPMCQDCFASWFVNG